jgi:hypothetical protein
MALNWNRSVDGKIKPVGGQKCVNGSHDLCPLTNGSCHAFDGFRAHVAYGKYPAPRRLQMDGDRGTIRRVGAFEIVERTHAFDGASLSPVAPAAGFCVCGNRHPARPLGWMT